jgi:hypothetical protein
MPALHERVYKVEDNGSDIKTLTYGMELDFITLIDIIGNRTNINIKTSDNVLYITWGLFCGTYTDSIELVELENY